MTQVSSSGGQEIPAARSLKRGQPFLEIYKKGQGYYTRVGTAVGGGILAAGFADFVHGQLNFDPAWAPGMWLKIGIPVFVLAGLALLLYWIIGVKRSSCDFLIATDGEMKKVNWTSRKEIVGATKVVILVTILTALALFFVDLIFMKFFQFIGVLRQGAA